MSKYKIELDVTEAEKNLLWKGLEELEPQGPGTASVIVDLKAKIDLAWIEGPEREKIQVEVLAKLQAVRGYLFRLKGFLEAEAAGYPRVSLDWTTKSLEIVKALQREVWKCQKRRIR